MLVKNKKIDDEEEEKQSPEKYCKEIQKRFEKGEGSKFYYYIFGCLSAFKNKHYKPAKKFLEQAPFVLDDSELIFQRVLKVAELKVLKLMGDN